MSRSAADPVTGGEPTLCPGCGAPVADAGGPVHAYVPSSPGCWRVFGELQADEALRFGYPACHRLVVDSYMAQHPGDGSDRRERQSVFVHLAGLCAVLDYSLPAARATDVLRRVMRDQAEFPVLRRAGGPGRLTVLDMLGAAGLEEYETRARAWARSVWGTWEEHHSLVRAAVEAVSQSGRA